MDKCNHDFESYAKLVHENQKTLAVLVTVVEQTSKDIDKLVRTQTDLNKSQSKIGILIERLEDNTRRIEKLESSQIWTIRSFVGGVVSILVGYILMKTKSYLIIFEPFVLKVQ